MAFTYFFRDLQTLEMLCEYALPELRSRRYINIWDAGCAMGPEPYTLAMLLRERIGHMHFRNIRIKRVVAFQKHDLLSLIPVAHDFGLILCKNVLLHFNESQRIEVIKMFHASLMDGGFLTMEQTQKLPKQLESFFEPVVSNAQLYRKVTK